MLSVPPSVLSIVNTEINKSRFDLLYDKYGSMIYTVILKAVMYDTNAVEKLMQKVFVELFTKKLNDTETSEHSCVEILRLVVTTCQQYGCQRDEIMKALYISPVAKPLERIANDPMVISGEKNKIGQINLQ